MQIKICNSLEEIGTFLLIDEIKDAQAKYKKYFTELKAHHKIKNEFYKDKLKQLRTKIKELNNANRRTD
jgi:hypothetical protein